MITLTTPSHLPLGVLDKEFSESFREEDYLNFILERKEIMVTFYSSVRECSTAEKKKYYEMFARIMCSRDFLPEKIHKNFTKNKMDIYGEEAYLNATIEQYEKIMSCDLVNGQAVDVARYLINNTDFSIYYGGIAELMFQIFSVEELLEHRISYNGGFLFYKAKRCQCDIERVKNIYYMNPDIADYDFYLYPSIMELFDDWILASFTEQLAFDLVHNYESDLKGEIRPVIEKIIKKKVNNVVPKKNENQGKNLLITLFNRVEKNN